MEVIDGECAPFDVIDSDNRSAEFLVDKPPEWSNEEEVRLLRAHGSGPMQASSSSSHQGVLGAPHLMSLWRREPLIWIGPRCFQSLCGDQPLAARQGSESAAEFQKVLDHPELVVNEPIGALAHLGLARAYVMQGDTAKAKATYQDFLTLWKNTDPDIPLFIAATAEYAKL